MPHNSRRFFALASIFLSFTTAPALAQPTIVFDFTYDTNNFFGAAGSPQRIALSAAATKLTSRFSDSLTSIAAGNGNTWTAVFDNPATGATVNLANPTIAQNTILVYAGGRDLASPTLGIGGPGGYSAGGSQAFLDNLASRGQAGALLSTPTDFGPWGGAITFDTVGTNWNFSLAAPSAGQADFLSVAEHELGHLLGIGTATSWDNKITGTTFTGAASRAANGGTNPSVTGDGGHWASGTTYLGQPVAMSPSITLGTRKEFTELDYAGLADIGWQVSPVPEPASILGLAVLWSGIRGVQKRIRIHTAA